MMLVLNLQTQKPKDGNTLIQLISLYTMSVVYNEPWELKWHSKKREGDKILDNALYQI